MNVGETLAHYLLEAEVGSGGMGVVYRARDLRLDRTVAIKLLAARLLADETARARLMREARLTSALNHPHICTVYEVGEAEGTVYLALEWVRGLTLHDILAGEPLPIETVLRCGGQIADALDHAHAHGVIHRDLKSANVIVTPEGRVKVLDFGLARRSADGPTTSPGETPQQLKLTTEGMMVGTPFAIAPEVLRGADGDERGDLWALGVLLYEMVTGVLPFQGRTPVELGSSILHDPLPALPARVPAGIRTIIQRCLAKEPGQRYQRASEVRAALETVESGESSRPGAIEPSPRDARPRVPRRVWQVAAGIGVLALALGAIMIARGVPGMGTPRVRSLAVLPLENLSGDPEQEYFVDGTTEALITQLAQIQALRVASRTSVMAYKGTRKSLPEIARELDVDAIVEGSVTRSGSRVRITAQLIHAPSDRHLWAQSYERELSNVLALQDEVTRDIAERIRLQLTPEERERLDRRQLVNPAVYDLYLKGRHQQNQLNEASVHKAIELYRQASELDPKDARPYSGLADAYAVLTQIIGTVPPEEGWPKVREYARRALALDESLADAHVSMGAVLWLADWDWDGAEREFRRALQLNPSYSLGRSVLGILLISVGRPEEGVGELRRALEQDSLSLFTSVNAEWGFYYARHYDEALRQGRRLLEIAPEFAAAHGAMRHVALARGQFATAIGHEAQTFPPPMRAAAETRLRAAFVAGGPRGYWEAEREASLARGFDRYWPSWLAAVEGQLGNHDAAIQWLDRALTVKDGNLAFLLVDASMDPLRRDPRFAAVLSRLRLAPPS